MANEVDQCWAIHDGAAGNRRQAIALAEALGWGFDEKLSVPDVLSKRFAPRLVPFIKQPYGKAFTEAMQNPPAYVIGCGRQAALATRLLKQAGSFAIQILNPRLPSHHWDVVIAPTHDLLTGSNVISTVGSLHDVTSNSLELWRAQVSALTSLKSPRTLVLIGGTSRMALFNENLIEVMFSKLEYDLAMHGGSLIICGSRRTPKHIAENIRDRFSGINFPVWFDEGDGENIYHSALAHADQIVLTPDSVNMISEACATQLPVFIAEPERAIGRMKILLDHLLKIGRVQAQCREMLPFSITPLNTMPNVLEQLKRFL